MPDARHAGAFVSPRSWTQSEASPMRAFDAELALRLRESGNRAVREPGVLTQPNRHTSKSTVNLSEFSSNDYLGLVTIPPHGSRGQGPKTGAGAGASRSLRFIGASP